MHLCVTTLKHAYKICFDNCFITINYDVDINECKDLRSCGYNQACSNTAGSYKCECLAGFKPDDSYKALANDNTFYHCNGNHTLSYIYTCIHTCICGILVA